MQLRLVGWSLRGRRGRNFLNAVTIAITASVVMLFVSVLVDLLHFTRGSADRDFARVLVEPKLVTGGVTFPSRLGTTFSGIDGVKDVECFLIIGGRDENGITYSIVGDSDSAIVYNTDFFPASPETIEAWKSEKRMGAIAGRNVADDLHFHLGQLVELPTENGPIQLKIVGFSTGGMMGRRIAVHIDYLQEFVKDKSNCQYRVISKRDDFARVANEIIERTKQSSTPAHAYSDTEFAGSLVRRVALVPGLLGFLGLFLLATAFVTIANTSAIAIRERRTELATLRVLGYKSRVIIRMILIEAVLIGLVGGLLGLIMMSILFRSGVRLSSGDEALLQSVKLSSTGIAGGLIVSVLIPIIGVLPSTLASLRMPLVTALRDAA